jgi:hypothetical protein
MPLGAPAVPVALNVTGLPVSPGVVAVSVFVPAVVPSVQPPTVAIPSAPVVWLPPLIVPPPDATANVTATPETALALASVAFTAGLVLSVDATVAVWLLPAFIKITLAGPGFPVAVKVTGLPVRPDAVAVSVFIPAVVPSVQPPTVAIPSAPVV